MLLLAVLLVGRSLLEHFSNSITIMIEMRPQMKVICCHAINVRFHLFLLPTYLVNIVVSFLERSINIFESFVEFSIKVSNYGNLKCANEFIVGNHLFTISLLLLDSSLKKQCNHLEAVNLSHASFSGGIVPLIQRTI